MTSPAELFDLRRVPAELAVLLEVDAVWEALALLDEFGASVRDEIRGAVHPSAVIEGPLFLAEGAEIGPYAHLQGPVYLAAGAKVGHAAFLRGPVVLGPDARVMHASEVKRSVLLGGARAPHFNYVGDSVVGHDVNLGAGVKLANFKTNGAHVRVGGVDIGLRKFGAAVGDGTSIGCNAVLAPGTIVGPGCMIYNGAMVRGIVPAHSVLKLRQEIEAVERQGGQRGEGTGGPEPDAAPDPWGRRPAGAGPHEG